MSRASVGRGCFGVRSSTQLPPPSFGWAGFRKRTSNSARRRPRPARKLPAGPARASGASPTLTWCAYRGLRRAGPPEPPPGLFERFARLRPLVETGWEMPVLVHALLARASEAELSREWRPDTWLADLGASREAAGAELDRVRDEWIARDEAGWLESHRFYRGVIERLRGLGGGPVRIVVVTTKEGRFARKLLARQGVDLDPAQVYGKEARRPKRTILRELVADGDAARLWFVEDRIRTLEDGKQA